MDSLSPSLLQLSTQRAGIQETLEVVVVVLLPGQLVAVALTAAPVRLVRVHSPLRRVNGT